MAAHQAPPSLGFSKQEHWSGLPFPSPMHESEKWKGSRSVVLGTSPRGYQIVRTHTKETTWIQDLASPNHPVQDASSKQQTKQKYKPNHQQTGLPPHSVLPIRGKTNKNSAQITPYTKLTQTTGPTLGGQKPKGRKNSTFFKERIQLSLKPGKRRPQTQ